MISQPQNIETTGFWPLVESRVAPMETAPISMTPRQVEKFKQSALQKPQKFLNSESIRVVLANRALRKRMKEKLAADPPALKGRDRNRESPCGSGKKLKKCCGYALGLL
jgi:uncharacterized protein YecA (UPF0149 family)